MVRSLAQRAFFRDGDEDMEQLHIETFGRSF
jgi:hypothetical protein